MTDPRDPARIREEIEETREELAETVEALAAKADVSSQMRRAWDRTSGRAPALVRHNPVPLAVAGAFLVGLLLGRRRGGR